jgi:hypothetical protein
MPENFFKQSDQNEDDLYRRLRDDPRGNDLKHRIEALWQQYKSCAPKGFVSKAQFEFHQCWWEMYLSVGLMNLGFAVVPSPPHRKGPDILVRLSEQSVLWIEAVAPNIGMASDRVPDPVMNGVAEFPKEKYLLRLSQALNDKRQKFEEYRSAGIMGASDSCIIALSACALNQVGTLLDFPVPVPLSVLAGAANFVLTGKKEQSFIQRRETLYKNSGGPVDMNLFETESFKMISAVLYSCVDPLNAPEKPETTFQIFINPNATNQVPSRFRHGLETWVRASKEKDEDVWKKYITGSGMPYNIQ